MFLKDRLNITTERQYTDEGFLIVPARISRTGIQDYLAVEMGLTDREPDSIVRVWRPEEEVFSEQSLSSFTNKPVTNNHPPVLVDASNAKLYSVGHAGATVDKDGMYAKTVLYITDAESIKAVESGKVELSNGYTADIDWTPGVTPDGEQYDAVQRNIKGNHIAIVERGRAGPACRVADNLPDNGEIVKMAKVTIDGVDFEVSEQAAQAVSKLQARISDTEAELEKKDEELEKKEDEMEEEKKDSEEEKETLKAQVDSLKAQIPTADTLDKMVADRTALIATVTTVAPDIKWQGKDAKTLKREVVALMRPNVQMNSVTDAYVDASFDLIVEQIAGNPQISLDKALATQVTKPVETKDNRPADVIAREKMMADSRDMWKKKGANK